MKEFTTTITEDEIRNDLSDALVTWEDNHDLIKVSPDGTESCRFDGITENEIIEDAYQSIVDWFDMFGTIRTDYYDLIDDIAGMYLEELEG